MQAKDKQSGLPVWVIEVIDADPAARDKTAKVKVAAPESRQNETAAQRTTRRLATWPPRANGPLMARQPLTLGRRARSGWGLSL